MPMKLIVAISLLSFLHLRIFFSLILSLYRSFLLVSLLSRFSLSTFLPTFLYLSLSSLVLYNLCSAFSITCFSIFSVVSIPYFLCSFSIFYIFTLLYLLLPLAFLLFFTFLILHFSILMLSVYPFLSLLLFCSILCSISLLIYLLFYLVFLLLSLIFLFPLSSLACLLSFYILSN